MASAAAGSTVARNYADTLLALAGKSGEAAAWGAALRHVANAISEDATLQRFLESPRIPAEHKSGMLTRALGDRVPPLFLRFLEALVHNRRQSLIPAIADEYDTLLDATNGIVHARVTVSRDTSDDERAVIADRLSKAVGRTVVPHLQVDPSILGGIVVRIGDTVMDGSVRRKLALLRRKMGNRG
ncbi:MAG: F0F1 ATP synthase subunit delta [Gemmatimonadaceae bacterium]|nr:F0F1 ATP synthase subunit delta [Gemmatimonadaceae bacterium]